MKMFKKVFAVVLTLCMLCCMGGCIPAEEANSGLLATYSSYEEIYEDYAQRIKDATPILINEYYEEAETNQDGITGLASICNKKIAKLAEITNDGVEEMAKFYYKKSSGKYEEYQEWSSELMDVYTDESQKITNAYLDSAT